MNNMLRSLKEKKNWQPTRMKNQKENSKIYMKENYNITL